MGVVGISERLDCVVYLFPRVAKRLRDKRTIEFLRVNSHGGNLGDVLYSA